METLGNTQFENIFGAGPRDRIAVQTMPAQLFQAWKGRHLSSFKIFDEFTSSVLQDKISALGVRRRWIQK
jgi:hypothetical protein